MCVCVCLPEGQQFGVSVCFLQHSFHQLFIFLRIHWACAVDNCLNLWDWQRGTEYKEQSFILFLCLIWHLMKMHRSFNSSRITLFIWNVQCIVFHCLKIIRFCICECVCALGIYSQERACVSSRACWVAIVCILLRGTELWHKSGSKSQSVNRTKLIYHFYHITSIISILFLYIQIFYVPPCSLWMVDTGSLSAEDEHWGSTMMTFKRWMAVSHSSRPQKASDRTRTSTLDMNFHQESHAYCMRLF